MKAIPGAVSARPPLAPSPRGPVVSPGVQTEETGAALRIPVSDPEGISSPDRLTPTTQARLEITAPAASTARESRRNGKGQDMPDAFPTSPAVGKAAVPKDFASSQSSTRKDDSGFDDWKKRTDNLAAAVLAAARVWREPGSPPYKPLDYKPAPTNEPLSVPRQDHEHEEGRRGSGQTNITPYARKEQHQGTKDVHGDEFDNPLSDKEEMRDLLSDWDLSHSAAVDLPKTTTAIESSGLAAALPAPSPAATAGGAQLSTASPAHAFPPLPLTPFRGLLPNPSVSPDIEGHARVGIGNENADTGGIHGTSERDSLRSSPAHRPVHQAGARAGVGLVFKESSEGVVVQSVLKQGGAATSTRPPQAGDLLVAVDSQDVRRKTLTQLRPMLMGEEGSEVVLAFEDADENVYTTSAQRRFPRFQFGARDENAGAQKSAGTMQTFGCAALDAHANAGDAHFEVRGRQPDDADSSGVSREGGARSDVGSKNVPLSAHSTEEDADDTPSWTNSWPGSLGASSYDKNPGKELYMVRRDAQARVEDILYRERLLQEELRRVKEHCVLQAKQEADARARLQHQNDVLRRENAHLHREVEHERLLREQEISFNAHLRQQLERQIRTLQDAAVLGGGAAGVDGIIGELDQAGRMADTDVGRRTGRTAQLHLMQDYANTAPPANTRESTNPEGVGPVAGDVEASAFVGEDGLTSEGRRRSLPQRQHVHEALGQAGASDEVGRNAAVSHHSSRAGSARVADVIAEAGSGGSRRRCPDESEARNGVGVYGSVAAGVSEWGGRELGGAGSGNIQREIFGEMPGEKEDEIIFTKEDVDMTSEINGNGWTGDVSVAPSIVSDDHLGASGTGAIKLPMTAGSRDGTTSTRRIDATSTLGMVGEEGAYFDEWSFSLPARQDELRKGKQNDEHLESESLSAPPISHDVGGIGDIRNAGHLDAVGFPGISAPLLSDEEDGSQGEAELGGVVEHDSFSSPPSAPTGAPLARRSGPRAVSGVLSVDVAGAVGDIDKPKSTSPLLYSTASVGEIHGRSVGSDASTPEVRIGGPQNASTDEGGEGLDGSGPGQGSLMMGPEMERQSVGEDLPIDVEDLYGAYY